ncbi:MAG: ketoacyl-ACP synthase III [Streptosporangiaceae bacterium]|nr:ketoacyl-ACP synthase III [Streptosporangiaceae bacterium]MBV9854009.1 ketoacyl-ACP synthase III [Streptosporangiaceae bacterium]
MTATADPAKAAKPLPASLAGIGHYFPGDPVPNSYFEAIPELGVDDDWIRRHTGVVTRHWPRVPAERHVEMGVKAARMALEDAGLGIADLDVIIGTTATARPRTNPSSAGSNYMDISLPLQRELGAHAAFCFDVTAVACAGFLYSSVLAGTMLSALSARNVLVVCAESPERILNFRYRNSVLFGAGAAAAVWHRSPSHPGLLDAVLRADGRHFGAFDIDEDDKMIMDGRLVGELGPAMLIDATKAILHRNELDSTDIEWLVPHQGNLNMVREVAAHFGLPEDRVLLNISRRGNTSSVGMPSCLSEHVHDGTVRPGQLLLGVSIGRGFSWGAMLFRYR